MKGLKEIRERGLAKYKGRNKALFWKEKEYLENKGTVNAGVVILPTKGCRWSKRGGCTMCGYIYDSARKISQNEIARQFEKIKNELLGVEYLKIFTSGSFLDPQEISPGTRKKILEHVSDLNVERLQIESRPEFIGENVLRDFEGGVELEIAIGLETANDFIREVFINKGFAFRDFEKAVKICNISGTKVKAYILIKPPFLGEEEAITDAIASSLKIRKLVDRISYNPLNVQKATLVEKLWKKGEYRPPWLWSVVEILHNVKKKIDIPVLSHPIAAGKERGPHNCGKCDEKIYKSLIDFSITQDLSHLKALDCDCKEKWMDEVELGRFDH
jgi:hypothetical protein